MTYFMKFMSYEFMSLWVYKSLVYIFLSLEQNWVDWILKAQTASQVTLYECNFQVLHEKTIYSFDYLRYTFLSKITSKVYN